MMDAPSSTSQPLWDPASMDQQQQQHTHPSLSSGQEKRPRSSTEDADPLDDHAKRPKLYQEHEADDVQELLLDNGCTAASEGECDEVESEPDEEGGFCLLACSPGAPGTLLLFSGRASICTAKHDR
jgi:hypothetical protein